MNTDSELSEKLYQEFLCVRKKQELVETSIPEITEICQRMTPSQRLLTALRISREARHEILQKVREEFPAWPEEFVRGEAHLRFLAICA